mmetsp:Transcript_45322/g.75205  ORF Transcript_45322/g.75205 Transcript_45322/m.75205 type:complete len:242 (+) Transcript_45322:1127-1852(+)
MFEEVEDYIGTIVAKRLQASISNRENVPLHISASTIVACLPRTLNIQQCDITQQAQALWHVRNQYIECKFGMQCIAKSEKMRTFLARITNNQNGNVLTVQPCMVHKILLSAQFKLAWSTAFNGCDANGIRCKCVIMGEQHEFVILPYIECIKLKQSQSKKVECSECSDANEWYFEQYLDYYGYHDSESKDVDVQSVRNNVATKSIQEPCKKRRFSPLKERVGNSNTSSCGMYMPPLKKRRF